MIGNASSIESCNEACNVSFNESGNEAGIVSFYESNNLTSRRLVFGASFSRRLIFRRYFSRSGQIQQTPDDKEHGIHARETQEKYYDRRLN